MSFLPSDPSSGSISPKATKVVAGLLAVIGLSWLMPGLFDAAQRAASTTVAVAVSGIFLYLLVRLGPVLSMILTNQILKIFKWQARVNPVETRNAIAIARRGEIAEAVEDAKKATAGNTAYETQIEALEREFPEDAVKLRPHLAALKILEDRKYAAIRNSEAAMTTFDRGTRRVEMIWNATEIGRKATRVAGRTAEMEALRKIQEDETIKAADDAMALSFAELTAAVKLSPDYEAPLKNMGAVEEVTTSLPAPAPQAGYPFVLEPHSGAKLRVVNARKDRS